MNNSIVSNGSLFQAISPTVPAEESQSVPALRNALEMGRTRLGDMMMDPRKLDAVLKAFVRKKKGVLRRAVSRN